MCNDFAINDGAQTYVVVVLELPNIAIIDQVAISVYGNLRRSLRVLEELFKYRLGVVIWILGISTTQVTKQIERDIHLLEFESYYLMFIVNGISRSSVQNFVAK